MAFAFLERLASKLESQSKSKVLSPPYPAYTELLLSSVPEMDPDWLTNLLAKRSKKARAIA